MHLFLLLTFVVAVAGQSVYQVPAGSYVLMVLAALVVVAGVVLLLLNKSKIEVRWMHMHVLGVAFPLIGVIILGFGVSFIQKGQQGATIAWTSGLVGCSFIVLFVGGLYASAGLSGGGFYSSCFIIILNMKPHEAIPLGYVISFGVGLGSFSFLVTYKPASILRQIVI